MPDAVIHPTPRELHALRLGKLSEADARAIAAHLASCSDCRQVVANQQPDSLRGGNQATKPHDAAPSGPTGTRLYDSDTPPHPPTVPSLPRELPPELAHHPKYRIEREIGRGGMGVVYLAVHTQMDSRVAIKVMNPNLLAYPDAVARFQQEVKAAARLDHPNIVRARDAEQAGSLHLLVMEFVEGKNLSDLVKQKGPLSSSNACSLVRQAALGLQHAFEHGMVHRDIKPQNLMLTPKLQVKILDFGAARLREQGSRSHGLTGTGFFMGTPDYIAPEQAQNAHNVDTRADLYGLGCTLYFLLTGRPPFQEETAMKTVLAHIEREPVPLHQVRPNVPEELSALVARLLAKNPAHRYQTPTEVAQALLPFIKPGAKPGSAENPIRPPGPMTPAAKEVLYSDDMAAEMLPAPPRESENDCPDYDGDDGGGPEDQSRGVRIFLLSLVVPAVVVMGLIGALIVASLPNSPPKPSSPSTKVANRSQDWQPQPNPLPRPPKPRDKPPVVDHAPPPPPPPPKPVPVTDPIKVELDKARAAHSEKLDEAKRKFMDALDAKFKEVAGKGNFDGAKKIEVQKKKFELDGTMPTSSQFEQARLEYDAEVGPARDALMRALKQAMEEYTKLLKLPEAESVANELKALEAAKKIADAAVRSGLLNGGLPRPDFEQLLIGMNQQKKWRIHPENKPKWEFKDGMLVGSGGPGAIFYVDHLGYNNFHLGFEMMINKPGQLRMHFRIPFDDRQPLSKLDAAYPVKVSYDGTSHADEWSAEEIIVQGTHFEVWTNGVKTQDKNVPNAGSKLGQIAFRMLNAETEIKIRKMEIKRLPSKP